MMCPPEMRWLLPLRRPHSATMFASFAHWRRTSTSTTLPCTTLDRCQNLATQSIQVFAKCVWKMHRRHSSSATFAQSGRHGIMGVAARSATFQSLGRSSSTRISMRGCYKRSHSAASAALEVEHTAGQAVVPDQVAQTAVARDGLMMRHGQHGWSRGSRMACRRLEMELHE